MEDWVFVDTCIWVSFFTRQNSREKLAVDNLLARDRVALVGPVVAEVLRGFRRREQGDWAGSRLRLAHYTTAD
jgi:predicted nucleic acid-binding protein